MAVIDVVGIGKRQMNYPKLDLTRFEDNHEKYLTIAKKAIKSFCPKIRPGLDTEMLRSDDAISNVATAIMIADWRWNPNHKGPSGRVKTKYSYRNQCAIWAIKAYVKRQGSHTRVMSLEDIVPGCDRLYFKDTVEDENRDCQPDTKMLVDETKMVIKNVLLDEDLSEVQRDFLRLYYMEGVTLTEIGKRNGISREAVRQTILRAISKARNKGESAYVDKA